MGFPAGAGGATIGSPAGGVLGSLLGGQISAGPAPNEPIYDYEAVGGAKPPTRIINVNGQLTQAPTRPTPMPTPVTPMPTPISGGKGGASVAAPAPIPASPSAIAPASQSGFNVNRASAQALQQAMGGTMGAMTGPLRIGQYMNPYTQSVIDRTQQDIERQRQMAANQLGAQASAAGAFGGSRQGVAEGVLAGEYGRMGADIAAQQRQAGYSQAMQSAMADRAARLGAAQQLAGLGQQAFTTGQTIQQQQAQQGLLQQAMQQQLIDAARGQYQGYIGEPERSMALPLEALGISQRRPFGTTESAQPGLFSGLQFLSGLPGMFKGF